MSDRKSTFSVNRMEDFSDGVLAIIITLLILEISSRANNSTAAEKWPGSSLKHWRAGDNDSLLWEP